MKSSVLYYANAAVSQFKLLVVKQCPLMSNKLLGNQNGTFFRIFLDELIIQQPSKNCS